MTNLEYVYKSKLLKNFSFWSVPRRHVSLHKAALLAPVVSFAPQVKLSQSFYQNKMLPKFLIHFFFFCNIVFLYIIVYVILKQKAALENDIGSPMKMSARKFQEKTVD